VIRAGGLTVVAALILAVPFAGQDYYTTLMLPFFAYSVILLGFNLLFGSTGLLSFGHSLFIGIGAYAAAFLTSRFGVLRLEVILLVAAGAAVVVAAPIGGLCVRYVKIYFAMLTLAFGMLFHSFLLKFYFVTGGDEGMRVLQPFLLGFDLSQTPKIRFLTGPYYYYSAAVLAVATFAMWRIVSSPFGLCLRSIRDNPDKAESLGLSVKRYRWGAFMISAAYAAVGGALLGPTTGQVDPNLAYWTHSGNIVFMTLLGGFAHFFGPPVGALVFIFLQDAVMSIVPYWRLVFGAILAFIVIVAPGGLMGLLDARMARWGEKARQVRVPQ
jgi:branched-chain amino acid transport system permease protein